MPHARRNGEIFMAFDAAMLHAVVHEINTLGGGGRIEKIYQPEKEEILIQMRTLTGGRRLLINCSSSNPRICFSSTQKENPPNAPMFCMLLRKHLTGGTLTRITQCNFERVAILEFNTRDEMGYECKKYLIAEIMGKYSNLIFTDGNMKIISAFKLIDFSTSSMRQVLPGMKYELPPPQDKMDPTFADFDSFKGAYNNYPSDKPCDKFITSAYLGIASSTAREMVYRAAGKSNASKYECDVTCLWNGFSSVLDCILNNEYSPCIIYENNLPVEYCFTPLTHYSKPCIIKEFDLLSTMLDVFYEQRDKEARVKQRAADLLKILTHSESRIIKKLEAQRAEIAECDKGVQYKKYGDLITANMYQIKRTDKIVEVTDYDKWNDETGEFDTCIIELDNRLSTSANAQRYYKKYNKSKTAKIELSKQIELGEEELKYIYTVFDALTKAEGTSDLSEIREELFRSGYASKMKGYIAPKKQSVPVVAKFRTTNGYTVYCGKNNIQNEYITHKLAQKNDYWFHAKNVPGSHVLLVTDGEEPPAEDFTDAAEIAAFYSKAYGGASIDVDYLFAKGVKKIAGAKPGMVIYHNNWSATVTPDEEKIKRMRVK